MLRTAYENCKKQAAEYAGPAVVETFGEDGFEPLNKPEAYSLSEKQEELQAKTLEMTSGGGAVKVVITGKKEIQELKINPDVVDPDDVEMLEDLIISAVNEAIRQVEEMYNAEMGRMTGGLGGMF